MPSRKKPSHFHALDGFLLFVPISALFYFLDFNPTLTFIVTAIAIVGISHTIVEVTSIIAQRVSTTISALINATFGNAIEFFIAVFSLRQGMVELVKASIVGSIMLNVLFLIGLSMFAGGLKYKEQRFNKDSAGLSSTMLIIMVVGLVLPSLYSMVQHKPAESMSLAVSIVLGIVYLLSLLYTLVTHKHLFVVERAALAAAVAGLRRKLRAETPVWVSWPKKSSKVPTTITEDVIREVALPLGFVDTKVCAVSEVWSGLKLVVRKELR